MRILLFVSLCAALLLPSPILSATSNLSPKQIKSDSEYSWLAENRSPQSLAWVAAENQRTLDILEKDPRFKYLSDAYRADPIIRSQIKATVRGDYAFNFDRREKVWRYMKTELYLQGRSEWIPLVDLKRMRNGGKTYGSVSAKCLPPLYERCLLRLGIEGQMKGDWREFDVSSRTFVTDGFSWDADSSAELDWISPNEVLLISPAESGDAKVRSSPHHVRIWERGQAWHKNPGILKTDHEPVIHNFLADSNTLILEERLRTGASRFHTFEKDQLVLEPWPEATELLTFHQGRAILLLKEDFREFQAGSLIAYTYGSSTYKLRFELVLQPKSRQAIQKTVSGKGGLIVYLLDQIVGRILLVDRDKEGNWDVAEIPSMQRASFEFLDAKPTGADVLLHQHSFLQADRILTLNSETLESREIIRMPDAFDPNLYQVEQMFASSADGTKVPYFLIGLKNLRKDGKNPTLITAYGGFGMAYTPYYLYWEGKAWLEPGGVFVVANIRGGGEYGPYWHQAATHENRQKAFDDLAAVAEDLLQRKISNPQRLAIWGGSNGGLLTSVSVQQKPKLYQAAVSSYPVLDLINFNSWKHEFGGDEIVRKYSPFQHIDPKRDYPEMFILTSTNDSVAKPANARKMAARLKDLGKPYLFYEFPDGGHSLMAGTVDDQIKYYSLVYTFLWRKMR